MPEEDYDQAIGSRQADSAGVAVFDLWKELGGGDGGLALELGAGSGAVTMGFVEAAKGFTTLVTDPSVEFLSLTRRKLSGLPSLPGSDVRCTRHSWVKISQSFQTSSLMWSLPRHAFTT